MIKTNGVNAMEPFWTDLKESLRKRVPAHSFRMWIEPLRFQECRNDRIILISPNRYTKRQVEDRFSGLIESEIGRISGKALRLFIEIEKRKSKEAQATDEDTPPVATQMALPKFTFQPASGRLLRKHFTFDQFVVDGCNNFAYTASLSLASRAKSLQNSLYLLAKPGLGKSHLSQAVGHYILSRFPGERVYYITAEDFTNEMIHAIRTDTVTAFKEKYRNRCDVLLLEDVHFLEGKQRTQVELALALDYLFDADKKIVFTSCYLPVEIPKINEQLRSRFCSSLISGIDPPGFNTRLKILRLKSKQNGCELSGPVTEYLAGELTENVRQLESGLLGVIARSSLMGTSIDLNLAKRVVDQIVRQKKRITVESIKGMVCKHYGISEKDIESRSRKQLHVRPRQMAIYLSRKYTDQTLESIGRSFQRYHATALHAVGVVEKGIRNDAAVKRQVEYFCKKLDSGDF
jgi:chromosomal replication initiator protein